MSCNVMLVGCNMSATQYVSRDRSPRGLRGLAQLVTVDRVSHGMAPHDDVRRRFRERGANPGVEAVEVLLRGLTVTEAAEKRAILRVFGLSDLLVEHDDRIQRAPEVVAPLTLWIVVNIEIEVGDRGELQEVAKENEVEAAEGNSVFGFDLAELAV